MARKRRLPASFLQSFPTVFPRGLWCLALLVIFLCFVWGFAFASPDQDDAWIPLRIGGG
jgi:hypothetical protein